MMDSYALEAAVYDRVYGSGKDYAAEVECLRRYIEKYKQCADTNLLDVGCGTGMHLEHLSHFFPCFGLDSSHIMLRHAFDNCGPRVWLTQADMRDFQFGRKFGVVTCLFSAIAHMLTVDEMRQAIANMADHVSPGGVLIVEPFFDLSVWDDDLDPIFEYFEAAKIMRVVTTSRNGSIVTTSIKHFVNWAEGRGTADFFDVQHKVALHGNEEYVQAFEDAGLTLALTSPGFDGRGIFVAQKPA